MGEQRVIISQDWITIIFAICILLIALAKLFSRVSITDMLSSYGSDRFVTITRTNDDGFGLLKIANLIVYALSSALIIYALIYTNKIKPQGLNTYLLCLLGVSTFLLFKHYLGKLLANILNFDDLMELVDFHRNVYRCMFSYALFVIAVFLFIVLEQNAHTILYVSIACAVLLFIYNMILVYTYKQLFMSSLFYFILYLCALEIAPYLLFYKYLSGFAH